MRVFCIGPNLMVMAAHHEQPARMRLRLAPFACSEYRHYGRFSIRYADDLVKRSQKDQVGHRRFRCNARREVQQAVFCHFERQPYCPWLNIACTVGAYQAIRHLRHQAVQYHPSIHYFPEAPQ